MSDKKLHTKWVKEVGFADLPAPASPLRNCERYMWKGYHDVVGY